MAEQRLDAAQVASTVDWLEDESRQLRARVGQLEQTIDQLAADSRDHTLRQRTDTAEIESLRQHLGRVPAIEEAVRQTQADIGDIRALLAQQAAVQERAERSYARELERLRLQIAEVGQRLTSLTDEVQPVPVRLQALGDHAKRQQDQLTGVQQLSEEIVTRQTVLQSKIDLSVEQTHRVEQGLAVIGNEFAPLRREDEVLASRVQLAMDLARQVDQKMTEILAEEQARRELAERVEILRTERQRIQQQLADLEHTSGGLVDRSEEHARLLRRETDRRQTLADRLSALESRLLDTRQSATEAIIQIWQATETRKRQDITLLQDQAKSLRETLQRLTRPMTSDETSDE